MSQQKNFLYFPICVLILGSECLFMDCTFLLLLFRISEDDYVQAIKKEISNVVKLQEELDIDVLVHGEPEVMFLNNLAFETPAYYLPMCVCYMLIAMILIEIARVFIY